MKATIILLMLAALGVAMLANRKDPPEPSNNEEDQSKSLFV